MRILKTLRNLLNRFANKYSALLSELLFFEH